MLDLQNTKNATWMHVFRAMFDRKGLDPIRVQSLAYFSLVSKNKLFYQKTKNVEWYTFVLMI